MTSYQDRQCKCNVTLNLVRATIVVVEKQQVLHIMSACLCSHIYPACIALAQYCHVLPCPAVPYFSHIILYPARFSEIKIKK